MSALTSVVIEEIWFEYFWRCLKLTGKDYRLPSESEWEYACRAGTTTPFYFGETITPELVNYDGNATYGNSPEGEYRGETTPVGQFPPNAFGLYDMHGNVCEFCQYKYRDRDGVTISAKDGSNLTYYPHLGDGTNNQRVVRGGSWYFIPRMCRSAVRSYSVSVETGNDLIGFRLVSSPPKTLE